MCDRPLCGGTFNQNLVYFLYFIETTLMQKGVVKSGKLVLSEHECTCMILGGLCEHRYSSPDQWTVPYQIA